MSQTYVSKILEAIAEAIDAPGKPAGLVVTTSRQQPSAAKKLIAVFPLQDKPDEERTPRTRAAVRRFLTVAVVCRCAGTDIDNEELRAWATTRLMADITLGGIAASVAEAITEWQGELDSQSSYSMAVMQFVVEYARPINEL